MKIITLQRFTDPDVLSQIGKELLAKLFQHFVWDLGRREYYRSVLMNSNSVLYFQRVAAILRAQDYLPLSFCQALRASEQMAAPENQSCLQATIAQLLPEAALAPGACPEALALQLWLSGKTSIEGQDGPPPEVAGNRNADFNRQDTLAQAPPLPTEVGVPAQGRETLPGTLISQSEERESASAAASSVPHFGSALPLANTRGSDGDSPTPPQFLPTDSAPVSGGAGEPSTTEPCSSSPSSDHAPSADPPPNLSSPEPAAPALSSTPPSSTVPKSVPPQRKGKVARLPKTVRDSINQMILDGFTYRQIIESLGDAGKDLSENAVSTWRSGGYQDWLEERQRLDVMVRQHEFNIDLARNSDGGESHQAAFEIAALRVCDLLTGFDPAIVRGNLERDPADYATLINSFARLLNSLPRLSAGNLNCRREAAARKDQSNEKRLGLSTPTRRKIEKDLNLL